MAAAGRITRITRITGATDGVPSAEIDGVPSAAGAYALLIELARPLRLTIATLAPVTMAAGSYLYLGSARGPGGIRARVARHLRRGKKLHWHVDHLTARGRITRILSVPGGSECRLVQRALRLDSVTVPVVGFGSSDCRRCPAHLLRLSGAGAAVLRALDGDGAGS